MLGYVWEFFPWLGLEIPRMPVQLPLHGSSGMRIYRNQSQAKPDRCSSAVEEHVPTPASGRLASIQRENKACEVHIAADDDHDPEDEEDNEILDHLDHRSAAALASESS